MSCIQNDNRTTFSIPQGVAENWKDFLNIQAERIVDEYHNYMETHEKATDQNEHVLIGEVGADEDEILAAFEGVCELWGTNKVTIHCDSEEHGFYHDLAYNILQDILRKIMLEPVVVEYCTSCNGDSLDGVVCFLTKTGYFNIDDVLPILAESDLLNN